MAGPILDFWFEFASTYSYPAAMRAGPLAQDAGVHLRWRPFLLGPIFQAQGWTTSPFNLYPAKGRNMWRDLQRICGDLGIPFERPHPFPQSTLRAARVALVALTQPWGEDFCRAIYRAEFGEARNLEDTQTIAGVLEDLGQNASAILERAQSTENKEQLRANTAEAQRLEIFGSPSFVTEDGELFWGNDRLEAALKWATR